MKYQVTNEVHDLGWAVRYFGTIDDGAEPTEDQIIVALLRRIADIVEPTPWDGAHIGELWEATRSSVNESYEIDEVDPEDVRHEITPHASFDRKQLAEALRRLAHEGIKAAQPPLHVHYTGESRDCDGRYSHGSDQEARPDESYSAFRDRVWSWVIQPTGDVVQYHSFEEDRGEGNLPRPTMTWDRQTEEGYSRGAYVICTEDDYDPGYSGYRDYTAERAGY